MDVAVELSILVEDLFSQVWIGCDHSLENLLKRARFG